MEAGEKIVEEADIVVAVWDGKPAAGLGGTADIVEYARELEKPLIWINPLDRVSCGGAAISFGTQTKLFGMD